MAVWPASLPPLPAPMDVAVQDAFLRSDMDTGPGKVRRRFTASAVFYTFTLRMEGSQYADLMTLYNTTVDFDMNDPVSGNLEQFQFNAPPDARIITGAPANADRILDVSIQLKKIP